MAIKTFKIGLSATDKQNMAQDIYERLLALTFSEYDSSETYNTGDFVVYNDALYQCKEDNVTGTWDSSKWQSATLQDLLDDVEGAVASVSGKANTIDLLNGTLVPAKSLVAEQLENVSEDSGTTQDNPFTFQATATNGGAGASDTAPTAKYLKLKGKTYAFNQLVDTNTSSLTLTNGHKYLTKISGNSQIVNGTGQSISVTGGTDQVFDLTQLFNGDIPEEITNGVSLPDYDLTFTGVNIFNQLFPEPYYAYNAGSLVSANATKLTTIGYNQFDGELEQGGINASTGAEFSSTSDVRSANFIEVVAGQKYTFSDETPRTFNNRYVHEYDYNKNFIKSSNLGNSSTDYGTIALTDNTHFVRLHYYSGSTLLPTAIKNACFHFTWDSSHTGYEEYVKHEYALGSELEDSPLLSAGDVCDEKIPNGTITRRVGVVDLGTLSWGYDSSSQTFYNLSSSPIQGLKANGLSLCSKYISVPSSTSLSLIQNMTYRLTTDIRIKDNDYTDAATFKSAMSGIYLYYELATPTEEQGDSFSAVVEVDDFGTMGYGGTNYNGYPQGCEFFYPADYVLFIDTLGNSVNWEAGDIAKNSELNSKFETYLKSLTGYDNTKTQTLKNVSGTLTWVDD